MRHQQKIVFSGEADQMPGVPAGDVVLILLQKEHPVFQRNGNDLIIEQSIPLIQSLTGCCFTITHLDGRELLVKTPRGTVIQPGEIRVIEGEGMPIQKTSDAGNLLVKIKVIFPPSGFLNQNQMVQLEKLLPGVPFTPNPEAEEVELVKMTPQHQQQQAHQQNRGRREAYEDDDDDDYNDRGGGVQCAQQ